MVRHRRNRQCSSVIRLCPEESGNEKGLLIIHDTKNKVKKGGTKRWAVLEKRIENRKVEERQKKQNRMEKKLVNVAERKSLLPSLPRIYFEYFYTGEQETSQH